MADLQDVLREIRDGIARNANPNETAVRTQIVQRILHELGWNVFDPDQVYNEYPLKLERKSRRIDLALCVKDRKPRCIVELKSTEYDLKEIGRSDGDRQLFEYAYHAGAPLALLTNGVNWRLYFTYSAGTYAERLVRALDIETEPPDEVAAALDRYLSYPNTASGKAADYARVDLDKRIDRHKAKEAIPRAWTRLVEDGPDGRLAALLLDATSSLVDSAPARQDVADYLRRLRADDRPASPAPKRTRTSLPKTLAPTVKADREDDNKAAAGSKSIRYHLFGKERIAKNARAAYITAFKTLAERDGGFLNRADPKLRGRKNRGLARTKRELSGSEPMIKGAALLPGDWWLLTHLSNKQKTRSLRIACEIAGVPFGDRAGLEIILPNA